MIDYSPFSSTSSFAQTPPSAVLQHYRPYAEKTNLRRRNRRCHPISASSIGVNVIDPALPRVCSHLKQDANAVGRVYATPCLSHGTEGFQNKMSIDSVCCIDNLVSSALEYKGALPLLEGHVTMTYGSSSLFFVMSFLMDLDTTI